MRVRCVADCDAFGFLTAVTLRHLLPGLSGVRWWLRRRAGRSSGASGRGLGGGAATWTSAGGMRGRVVLVCTHTRQHGTAVSRLPATYYCSEPSWRPASSHAVRLQVPASAVESPR